MSRKNPIETRERFEDEESCKGDFGSDNVI